jgi:anti-anti-sigma factor
MALGDVTLEIDADHDGDVVVVAVKGRLTIGRVEEMNDFLCDLLDKGCRKFVFDLRNMEHIVSGGIGVLIGFNERLKSAGGTARLAEVHPRVRRIFSMMSLDAFFKIYDHVDQAKASFNSAPA